MVPPELVHVPTFLTMSVAVLSDSISKVPLDIVTVS